MKFTDGQWLIRQGFTIEHPHEVRDLETGPETLTVYAPVKHLENRGMTHDCPLLTYEFFAPLPDVIGVRLFHFKGGRRAGPEFAVARRAAGAAIRHETTHAVLQSGNLSVRINKQNGWRIDFYHGQKRLTGSGFQNAGYITAADGQTFIREQLDLGVGECVYGLGEHFTAFVKNGQAVESWNADGGTSSEQAYKNIPFYLTNRGYGVLVNHPERVSFEVASENVNRVQFSVPGECLEYLVIGGPTPKRVLQNYTALTGRPALPPAWSFGLWLTTSFVTDYDEPTVNHFIEGMAARDLPLHVFHFDCFWMKEYRWCDFQWDEEVFPEPRQMLARLKEKGLRICVWINPYIAQRSRLFGEGMAAGYLLRGADGGVWQWDRWQAGMGLVDFTNPAACAWYAGYLQELLAMGVDCFKTDFGERIPTDVVYFDGSDPLKMHNYYTYLYNKLVFEVLAAHFGRGKAVVFARSATVGGQQFPVHWGGDCRATFESMAESLRGGLSLGLSGFGFWSHDIGGFERTAPAAVYKRWVAFGLLSSHSRLHGEESYRVPWLFDEEAVAVLRFFTKLKCRLMPYLFAKAREAAQEGVPVMRAMLLEFPADPGCDYLDRQYMLGDSLLVAPVFREDGRVSYYLPEGTWTHLLRGATLPGGGWREEGHDYLSLPLLVRPNTLLALGAVDHQPDYDFAAAVTLHLFQLGEGQSATAQVFNPEGALELEVTARRNGARIAFEAAGAGKPWRVLLRGIDAARVPDGCTAAADPLGLMIEPGRYQGKLAVALE